MKKMVLLLMIVLSAFTTVNAENSAPGDLGATLDLTYMSRQIWRGFDLYKQNHASFEPKVTVDLWGSGFGFSVLDNRRIGGGSENFKRMEFSLFYGNKFFKGETYQTNYTVGWTYYNFYELSRKDLDMQEFFGSFSFPKLLPCGIVPSYTAVVMYPTDSSARMANDAAGWLHILGLGYSIKNIIPDRPEQTVDLSTALVYNDGVGGTVFGTTFGDGRNDVDSDWSHAVFGVSTKFKITDNMAFTPGFYFQKSFESSVNTSDEYWTSMNVSYKF